MTESLVRKSSIAATGIAAALIGWFLPVESWEKLLLALSAACLGIFALGAQVRKPALAFYVLVVLGVALPCEFGGTVSRAPMNAPFFLAFAICALWAIDIGIFRRGAPLLFSGIVSASIALIFAILISFVLGQLPIVPSPPASMASQAIQLLTFVSSVGLFLAAGHMVKTTEALRRLNWLFVGVGATVCAIQVATGYGPIRENGGSAFDVLDRVIVSSSIGSVFWVWLVALSLSQALFNRTLSRAARLGCAVIVALALFRGLVLARSWVSGWLPALIAVLIVLLLKAPRLTIVVAVVAVFSWLYVSPPVSETFVPSGEEYSQMTRAEAARVLWPLILKSPLVGFGPANYYEYTQLFPILGWYVRFNSHNQYLDLLAQIGFLGVAAFGWLIWEIAALAWRCFRRFRGGFCQSYAVGVLAGLAGTLCAGLLADWIIPFYFNIGIRGFRSSLIFWVMSGGVLVLQRAAQAHETALASASSGGFAEHRACVAAQALGDSR